MRVRVNKRHLLTIMRPAALDNPASPGYKYHKTAYLNI
jgi:hypothetical protein